MAGDEVAFYFRPNQHVWELILRKQLIWDDEGNLISSHYVIVH